ncbi:MAG: hypothetical protein C4320_00445 [Armatimonadota bacterium]
MGYAPGGRLFRKWNVPGNAAGSPDGVFAEQMFEGIDPEIYPNYSLRGSNYGFTAADIQESATVTGIEVRVTRFANKSSGGAPNVKDAWVYLVGATGTLGAGTDLGSSENWATSIEQKIYGSPTTLAGQSFTPADITNSNFGVLLGVQRSSSGDEGTATFASVDAIEIRVHYTVPGASPGGRKGLLFSFFGG